MANYLAIHEYCSLHASQPRMQRTSCQVTLNAVLNLNFFGLVDSDQFTDMLIVWDIFYFSGGSHIV